MTTYLLPILILFLLIYAKLKKVNSYSTFVEGAKKSFDLILNIFPYIATIMIAVALFDISGATNYLIEFVSPIFTLFGIPKEVLEIVLLKPFTGSGSLALLDNIFTTYGVDSYISRCACVILGSSETIFYVSAVYFADTSIKKVGMAIPICLIASFVGAIFACLFCRIL